jgi:hypothetical protein
MYIILFRTTQIFLSSSHSPENNSPSHSISHQFFSYFAFCWCERCEKENMLRGEDESEKEEKGKVRKCGSKEYTK